MDPLRDLIDHPPHDADAPRNPVLTTQVMERVRSAAVTRPAPIAWWPLLAVAAVLLALAPLDLDPGALADAWSPALVGELLIAIVIALPALLLVRRSA